MAADGLATEGREGLFLVVGRVTVAFGVAALVLRGFCVTGFPPLSGFDVLALEAGLTFDGTAFAFVEFFGAGFLPFVGDGLSS